MTEPWWRPIADALAAKVAKAIKDYEPTEEDKVRVLDAAFEDIPAKAPRTRRKPLPPGTVPVKAGEYEISEK